MGTRIFFFFFYSQNYLKIALKIQEFKKEVSLYLSIVSLSQRKKTFIFTRELIF
jgi:hypothetical protein